VLLGQVGDADKSGSAIIILRNKKRREGREKDIEREGGERFLRGPKKRALINSSINRQKNEKINSINGQKWSPSWKDLRLKEEG